MDIKILENIAIDWVSIPSRKMNGVSGFVLSKTVALSKFTIRQLEFSVNYEADHWCKKGHIIHVLKGELIIAYDDGSTVKIAVNNSIILGDNIIGHKAKTMRETQIIIID